MAKDPVCGMTVDESSGLRAERDGRVYYFCSAHCRQTFLAQTPTANHCEEAVKPTGQPAEKTGMYTCPMHPEIRQQGPGACPKCGMDLEPERAEDGREEDDPELRAMTRRFWVLVVLGLPVLLLAMLPMWACRWIVARAGGDRTGSSSC